MKGKRYILPVDCIPFFYTTNQPIFKGIFRQYSFLPMNLHDFPYSMLTPIDYNGLQINLNGYFLFEVKEDIC